MIQANLLGVQQNFDFGSKRIRSFVVFELGGKHIRAEVEDIDEVQTLVSAGLDGAIPAPEPAPQAAPPMQPVAQPVAQQAPPPVPQAQQGDTERVVDWATIPDDIISPTMKQALHALEAPHAMESSKLRSLLKSIEEEFSADDWAEIGVQVETVPQAPVQEAAQVAVAAPYPAPGFPPPATAPQPPPPAPAPRAAAPVGEVVWHDGSPILPGAGVRARTVQADEYGYPIVSNSDVDPGEVVERGGEGDEDGVSQF